MFLPALEINVSEVECCGRELRMKVFFTVSLRAKFRSLLNDSNPDHG